MKNKNNPHKKTVLTPPPVVALPELEKNKWPYVLVVLLGLLLYANTIGNNYAFDDSIVVTENSFTKSGIKGIPDILTTDFLTGMWGKQMKMYEGGRYRPLSLVTLAIEYQFFGENPHVSHFINMVLYGLTAFLLYIVLQKLFKMHPRKWGENLEWYISLPFVITLLFIAHPIHTEVVANIKGRDEVMTLLFMLAAWWYSLLYIEQGGIKNLVLSGIMLFLAMLSKESGITFLAVIPISIYFFTNADRKKILVTSAPLLIASFVFLQIRSSVLGGLPSNDIPPSLLTDSFVGMSGAERYATTFFTYLVYLKLMFFPHPLTYDYYPYYIPIKHFGNWEVLGAIVLNVSLVTYAIWQSSKKNIIAFGIIYFWATFIVVSNLLFSVGVFMSERFVYAPSLGFILALVFSAVYLGEGLLKSRNATRIIMAGFSLMLIAFSVKTIDRNRAWKDSYTLFTTDGKVSGSTSFKSAAGAGELLLFKARKTENETEKNLYYDKAITYFETAIRIFPDYIYVLQYMGDAQLERHKDYAKSVDYYSRVFQYRPDYTTTYEKIERVFDIFPYSLVDADFRIATWEKIRNSHILCQDRFEVNVNLGRLYGAQKNDISKAIYYLKKADAAKPNTPDVMIDLAVAYSLSRQFSEALVLLERAVKLEPNSKLIWTNLARVYAGIGNQAKAQAAQQKADTIK